MQAAGPREADIISAQQQRVRASFPHPIDRLALFPGR